MLAFFCFVKLFIRNVEACSGPGVNVAHGKKKKKRHSDRKTISIFDAFHSAQRETFHLLISCSNSLFERETAGIRHHFCLFVLRMPPSRSLAPSPLSGTQTASSTESRTRTSSDTRRWLPPRRSRPACTPTRSSCAAQSGSTCASRTRARIVGCT